jgi:ribose 5-phosphate isomerase RpiB
MRVGIATDHGGFSLKEDLVAHLREAGHEVVDFGAYVLNTGDDYPDSSSPSAELWPERRSSAEWQSVAAAWEHRCV